MRISLWKKLLIQPEREREEEETHTTLDNSKLVYTSFIFSKLYILIKLILVLSQNLHYPRIKFALIGVWVPELKIKAKSS